MYKDAEYDEQLRYSQLLDLAGEPTTTDFGEKPSHQAEGSPDNPTLPL